MLRRRTSVLRKLSMYGFELVQGAHSFYALLEFDVGDLRSTLRRKRAEGGGGSLFAFLLKAIGKSLEEHPELNSMVNRRTTTVFSEVDVDLPVEVERGGELVTKQHIVRDINRKTLPQVDAEIAEAKKNAAGDEGFVASPLVRAVLGFLPGKLVVALFRLILRSHPLVKEYSGTVFVTSVSMFSNAPGFVIPYSGGPKAVSFALGSSVRKPVVRGGEIVIRELLSLTAAFNHDAVDGAPAARFLNTLRNYVERDYVKLL